MAALEQPVKALKFLQKEVSEVVDHDDPDESAIFRGLLEHLLEPKLPPFAVEPQPSTEPLTQTNEADNSNHIVSESQTRRFCSIQDPKEDEVLSDGIPASGELYMQRTETFEALLEFVAEGDKQPKGNLVQLIEGAGWS
jgi:muskelin